MICILNVLYLLLLCNIFSTVNGNGLLLLYKPRDISHECGYSQRLIYDVSYGMGMSDTLTLILRTLTETDYECTIEVVTEYRMMIVVVVKYPTTIAVNCAANPDAFIVRKKDKCIRLCDSIADRDIDSPYFVFVVEGKVRLRFVSNSSINSDIGANLYQITTTAARKCPLKGCNRRNESYCAVSQRKYCFTSGVVCDGIVNCGVLDWFDERKSDCGLPVERLGIAPIIAVIAALVCFLLATCHVLLRCLPPLASSFFIFNANEDNRLCIDPVFTVSGVSASIEVVQRNSLIPVSSSSSSNSDNKVVNTNILKQCTIVEETDGNVEEGDDSEAVNVEVITLMNAKLSICCIILIDRVREASESYLLQSSLAKFAFVSIYATRKNKVFTSKGKITKKKKLKDLTVVNEPALKRKNNVMKSVAQKLQNTFQSLSK